MRLIWGFYRENRYSKLLSLLFLLVVSSPAFAQSDSIAYRHIIKSNLTQYAVGDFGIEYEYMTKANIGFFAGASYKKGTRQNVSSGSFLWQDHPTHFLSAEAYTASLGTNLIIDQNKRGSSYFSGSLFYRKMHYDRLIFNTSCSRDMCIHQREQSMQGTVFGWKALLGYRWFFPISNKLAILLDVFGGMGYRAQRFNYTVYGTDLPTNHHSIQPLDNPYEGEEKRHPISLQAGVKIGFSIK